MFDWNAVSTWSIRVVGHEPDNLEFTTETLKRRGIPVKTARLAGFGSCEALAADVDFADRSMPTPGGAGLLGLIRVQLSPASVIEDK
jgi:hypothetical protein